MREFKIDPLQDIPTIDAVLKGRLGSARTKLVFDTGAARTQFHTPVIEALGYSASNASGIVSVAGPSGPAQQGYLFQVQSIRVLGVEFNNIEVAALDFDNFSEEGLEGLLGWDLIKHLHLEMDGASKILRIY